MCKFSGALPENGAAVPSRTLLPPETGCSIFLISSGTSKRYGFASASLSLPQTLLKKWATCSKGRRAGRTDQKKLTVTAPHRGVSASGGLVSAERRPSQVCGGPALTALGATGGASRLLPLALGSWFQGLSASWKGRELTPQTAQWIPSMVWLGLLPGGWAGLPPRGVGGASSRGCGQVHRAVEFVKHFRTKSGGSS